MVEQEVGGRAGEVKILVTLGRCKMALGEYEQGITCHTEPWAITQELDLEHDQTSAAMDLGFFIWAQARVEHGNAAATSTTPSAYGHTAAYMDSMRNATQWMRTSLSLALNHGFGFEEEKVLLHWQGRRGAGLSDEVFTIA